MIVVSFWAAALLSAGAPPLPAPEREKREVENAADSPDKVICKRFTETGSLVRGYRMCKTKADWERYRETNRMQAATDSCRDRANGGAGC